MNNKHDFARLTTTQARSLGPDDVIVQPIGAIEAHGPHLPLSTDALIADELSTRIAETVSSNCWFLPTLAYGRSVEHEWAAGTITMSTHTALAVIDDIGRSVASTGVRRIVFLNTHGGNSALLNVACRDLRQSYNLLTFVVHPVRTGLNPEVGDCEHGVSVHGGVDETSIMLHLAPELVQMDKAECCIPNWHEKADNIRFDGSVDFGWLSSDLSSSGVGGDPTLANSEWGAKLVDLIVKQTCVELAEIERFTF